MIPECQNGINVPIWNCSNLTLTDTKPLQSAVIGFAKNQHMPIEVGRCRRGYELLVPNSWYLRTFSAGITELRFDEGGIIEGTSS